MYRPSNTSARASFRAVEVIVPGSVTGLDRMRSPQYNKGLAFTIEERQTLGIHGLMPTMVKSEDDQVAHCMAMLDRYDNGLDKYLYLQQLRDRNERLFFRVLNADICAIMPIVYTPTVAQGCEQYSQLYERPQGMFISIYDRGHIYELLCNWPENDVRAIVVTDGERILGLGDLGANGMAIPVGKLTLYTALAGIPPQYCLPITLDVGTNNQNILNDRMYIGVRQKRCSGSLYDDFIEEFMMAVVRRFGPNCLIQFEDFGNANAFRLLDRYRKDFCTFNDDIQGTAAVTLAGLLASLRGTGTRLSDHRIMFFGAGEAALGTARLLVRFLMMEGRDALDARRHIWLVDSKGLVVNDRPKGGITKEKALYAHDHIPVDTLSEAIDVVKPTMLIGASAQGGAFTPEVLQKMAENNKKPVIFALSNPTSKAECTAEEAYKNTNGSVYFASGSPFAPVKYKGKTFYPGQGNNAYVFPGVALGIISAGAMTIPDGIFLRAALKLASLVTDSDLERGCLFPPMSKIREVSYYIAEEVMDYSYEYNLACHPRPTCYTEYLQSQCYDLSYPKSVPVVYQYPDGYSQCDGATYQHQHNHQHHHHHC